MGSIELYLKKNSVLFLILSKALLGNFQTSYKGMQAFIKKIICLELKQVITFDSYMSDAQLYQPSCNTEKHK